ncbi:MAG: sugar ABC transporter permease [Clostridia bacterium]|nr:sugar ABC transporter permease [Clostridia bacterium]
MRKEAARMTRAKRDNIYGTLFAASPIIGFFLFGLLPMLFSVFLSFGKLTTFDLGDMEFVGFENYARIFAEDDRFFKSIGNTFLYAIVSVLLSLVFSLFLAQLLAQEIHGKKVFRVILFIPYVCSAVAISTMWKWLLDYNFGVLNDLMTAFGAERVDWLNEKATAMPMMIFMSVWGGLGYNMILYTAALTSVNRSYYEAAEIDGASKARIFMSITVPLISPTTFFLLIMGFIGALQSFANFQIMTPYGGPDDSTLSMVLRVYNAAFVEDSMTYGMGYASALGWIVGIIVMIFSAINFVFSKKWVQYG